MHSSRQWRDTCILFIHRQIELEVLLCLALSIELHLTHCEKVEKLDRSASLTLLFPVALSAFADQQKRKMNASISDAKAPFSHLLRSRFHIKPVIAYDLQGTILIQVGHVIWMSFGEIPIFMHIHSHSALFSSLHLLLHQRRSSCHLRHQITLWITHIKLYTQPHRTVQTTLSPYRQHSPKPGFGAATWPATAPVVGKVICQGLN